MVLASTGPVSVFVDKLPVHLLGDYRSNVACGNPPGTPPITTAIEGSLSVFVDKKPLVRLGDKGSLGDSITMASISTFADG
jgi:uncharacterized Zn-binding protein involved in type VI secretion